MTNFDNYKTEIFDGINSNPRVATSDKASNGSDLIHKVNGICNQLNSSLDSYWNNTELFLDTNDGDDLNDGLTSDTAKKTTESLVQLISSKTINQALTLDIKGSSITTIDLQGIRNEEDAILIIKLYSDSNQIVFDNSVYNNLLLNIPENLIVKFSNCDLKTNSKITIGEAKKITIENSEFRAEDGYTGELLEVFNLKESIITGNRFTGDVFSYDSENLLVLSQQQKAKLYYNSFYRSAQKPIKAEDSNLYMCDKTNLYGYDGELDEQVITISGSKIVLEKTDFYTPQNTEIINSKVIDHFSNNQALKSYYWNFENLSDETRLLIPSISKNASISELRVFEEGIDADFDLHIDGNRLFKTNNLPTVKTFDLKDKNNRLSRTESKSVSLIVTGTASKITVQVDFLEF